MVRYPFLTSSRHVVLTKINVITRKVFEAGVGKKENFPSGKKDNFLISEKKGKKDFFKPTKRKQRKERFFEL